MGAHSTASFEYGILQWIFYYVFNSLIKIPIIPVSYSCDTSPKCGSKLWCKGDSRHCIIRMDTKLADTNYSQVLRQSTLYKIRVSPFFFIVQPFALWGLAAQMCFIIFFPVQLQYSTSSGIVTFNKVEMKVDSIATIPPYLVDFTL